MPRADVDIPAGEMVVLLGPSGSGKSTLLNILGGLDRVSEGTVTFEGRDLTAMSDAQLTRYRRDHVGFVFQFYNLMPSLTAYENVELVTEIARDPMSPEDALGLVGLRERADSFPSQLSGGEQQRVAIARAVAKQPTVLFCDEPTGALDSSTGRAVLQVLKSVNSDLEVVVELLSTDAVKVSPGDRVLFEDWGGPGTLNSVIDRVDPLGFTKLSALGVEKQRVNNGIAAQILQGLESGDTVVLYPASGLIDGTPVEQRRIQ